jgi:hypothetical protein
VKRIIYLIVSLTAVIGAAVISATPAFACDPLDNNASRTVNFASYGKGWYRFAPSGTDWDWILADIESHDPSVHTMNGINNHDNGSTNWVMLDQPSVGQVGAWAQVGPMVWNDNTHQTFAQCNDGSNIWFLTGAPFANGTTHTYEVKDANSGIDKNLYVDTHLWGTCFDADFAPHRGDAGAEIHNRRDQVFGRVADHAPMTSTQAKTPSSSAVDFFGAGAQGIIGNPGTWFHKNIVNNTRTDVWDGDCP